MVNNSRKLNFIYIGIIFCTFAMLLFMINARTVDYTRGPIQEINIATSQELLEFSNSVNNGNGYRGERVVLTNDIDLSELDGHFTPIGIFGSNNYFSGIFDGQGHTIKNIIIDTKEGESNNGLFGGLCGTVCNLVIDNGYIEGNECGAICATSFSNDTAIYNCSVINTIINANNTDGVCGWEVSKRYNTVFDNDIFDNSESYKSLDEKVDILNNNLKMISNDLYNIPINKWEVKKNKLVLAGETEKTIEFGLFLRSRKKGEPIKSFYCSSDDTYYIVLPFSNAGKSGYIEILDTKENGQAKDVIFSTDNDTMEIKIEYCGEKCKVKILPMENTSSIFVSTNEKYAYDILTRNKNNALTGQIQVYDEYGRENYNGRMESISGRGYHSWQWADKKGYGFELMDKGNLLKLGMAKDYVLISGYRDESLLSYIMTMQLDEELDWPYATGYRLVNFYLDGEYQGLYILCEKMEVGKSRVDIKERADLTGAYLYEMRYDSYEEKEYFKVDSGNTYLIRAPKLPSEEERNYSISLWNDFEEAVYSEDGYNSQGKYYSEYIDLSSWARLFMILELNGEYSLHGSLYFYKECDAKGDGKIYALQPWDVEHSYTATDCINSSILRETHTSVNNGLLKTLSEKEEMRKHEKQCWQDDLRPAIIELLSDYDNNRSFLWKAVDRFNLASKANEAKWGKDHNFVNKAITIEKWLNTRIDVLDNDSFY